MPRPPRIDVPDVIYHVTNRGNGRMRLFHTDGDFAAFERVLAEGLARFAIDLLSYCLMGNHWHLVLRPREAGALGRFMQWIVVTHVRRHHAAHHTAGGGHLYQGRFKSFPIERDEHLLNVLRYVEANALRAGLVMSAQDWPWCSLYARLVGEKPLALAPWPVDVPADWAAVVNEAMPAAELARIRTDHVNRGRPYGTAAWVTKTARKLELQSTLRDVGRPRKEKSKK